MTTPSGRGGQPARRGRPAKQSTGQGTSKQTSSRQTSSSRSSRQASSRSTSGQTTGSTQSTAPARKPSRSAATRTRSTTVHLPFVTAQFRAPDFHLPSTQDVSSAADSIRPYLPPRNEALFYGALTLGVVFTLIEWPVALAIGAGTALVSRSSVTTARAR